MKYAHTNIVTKDWKRLSDFYVKVFDCKVVPPIRNQEGDWLSQGTGVIGAKLEGAHLLLPGYGESGPTLEIYQYGDMVNQDPLVSNQRGFGHIAFEVEDVMLKLKEMLENGGEENGKVTSREVMGVGVITFVYARDPDGNLIELQSWEKD